MAAVITTNADGLVIKEQWGRDDYLHRVDGPAIREWQIVDGVRVLTYEEWRLEGKRHRVDGPGWREW